MRNYISQNQKTNTVNYVKVYCTILHINFPKIKFWYEKLLVNFFFGEMGFKNIKVIFPEDTVIKWTQWAILLQPIEVRCTLALGGPVQERSFIAWLKPCRDSQAFTFFLQSDSEVLLRLHARCVAGSWKFCTSSEK